MWSERYWCARTTRSSGGDGALRRLLGLLGLSWTASRSWFAFFLPVMDLLSFWIVDALLCLRISVKPALGVNSTINDLLRRHGHLCSWRAGGCLSRMSS